MPSGICARTFIATLALVTVWAAGSPAHAACDSKKALGVERVVEVDTTNGPRLGHVQYKDIDFLRPGEVVLTFDDGPSNQMTPKVLDALDAHCTKAIFFMVGRMAIAYPDMARRVAENGHTVASHTWSHKNLARLSSKNVEKEVELGLSAISAALGKPIAPFFRFPYLSDSRRSISHLETRDHAIISIDVDSYDWKTRTTSRMSSNVFSQLDKRGKGIILFHDIQRVTANGLKGLLDELKRRKYKVVQLVPKSTAATLAPYDDMAKKLLAKKSKIAVSNALTTRSVVWPLSGSMEPSQTVVRPASQPSLKPKPAAVTVAADDVDEPVSRSSTNSSTKHRSDAQPGPAKPTPRQRSEPTLFEEVFGKF